MNHHSFCHNRSRRDFAMKGVNQSHLDEDVTSSSSSSSSEESSACRQPPTLVRGGCIPWYQNGNEHDNEAIKRPVATTASSSDATRGHSDRSNLEEGVRGDENCHRCEYVRGRQDNEDDVIIITYPTDNFLHVGERNSPLSLNNDDMEVSSIPSAVMTSRVIADEPSVLSWPTMLMYGDPMSRQSSMQQQSSDQRTNSRNSGRRRSDPSSRCSLCRCFCRWMCTAVITALFLIVVGVNRDGRFATVNEDDQEHGGVSGTENSNKVDQQGSGDDTNGPVSQSPTVNVSSPTATVNTMNETIPISSPSPSSTAPPTTTTKAVEARRISFPTSAPSHPSQQHDPEQLLVSFHAVSWGVVVIDTCEIDPDGTSTTAPMARISISCGGQGTITHMGEARGKAECDIFDDNVRSMMTCRHDVTLATDPNDEGGVEDNDALTVVMCTGETESDVTVHVASERPTSVSGCQSSVENEERFIPGRGRYATTFAGGVASYASLGRICERHDDYHQGVPKDELRIVNDSPCSIGDLRSYQYSKDDNDNNQENSEKDSLNDWEDDDGDFVRQHNNNHSDYVALNGLGNSSNWQAFCYQMETCTTESVCKFPAASIGCEEDDDNTEAASSCSAQIDGVGVSSSSSSTIASTAETSGPISVVTEGGVVGSRIDRKNHNVILGGGLDGHGVGDDEGPLSCVFPVTAAEMIRFFTMESIFDLANEQFDKHRAFVDDFWNKVHHVQ